MTHLDELIAHWNKAGIAVPEGASPLDITNFEQNNNVLLPDDFSNYFSTVNGMGERGTWDSLLFSFWCLQDVVTIADDVPDRAAKFQESNRYFMFADHSIALPTFAIRLSPNTAEPNPIAAVITDFGALDVENVFESFTEFIAVYLNTPEVLMDKIPAQTVQRLNETRGNSDTAE